MDIKVHKYSLPTECSTGSCPSGLWGMNSVRANVLWASLPGVVGGTAFKGTVVDSGARHTHVDLAAQVNKALSKTFVSTNVVTGDATDDEGHGEPGHQAGAP